MEEIKDLINKGKGLESTGDGNQDFDQPGNAPEDMENQLDSFEETFSDSQESFEPQDSGQGFDQEPSGQSFDQKFDSSGQDFNNKKGFDDSQEQKSQQSFEQDNSFEEQDDLQPPSPEDNSQAQPNQKSGQQELTPPETQSSGQQESQQPRSRRQESREQKEQANETGSGSVENQIPEPAETKEINVPEIEKGPLFIRRQKFESAVNMIQEMRYLSDEIEEVINMLERGIQQDRETEKEARELLHSLEGDRKGVADIISPEKKKEQQ